MIASIKNNIKRYIKNSELTSHSQMFKQIKIQKFTLFVFGAIICMQAWVNHQNKLDQFVIVKDGVISSKYGSNWASINVFENNALTDANLFFNITPSTAQLQGEMFLKNISPALYDDATNMVNDHIDDIKSNRYSMTFEPDFKSSTFNKKGDVTLSGNLIKYQGGLTAKPQKVTIKVHYDAQFGKIQKTRWSVVYG